MNENNRDINVNENDNESLVERFATVRKKRKKTIIIVFLILIAVGLIAFTAICFVGKSGYSGTVDAYVDAFADKDYNAVTEQLSSYYSALKLSDISIAENLKYFNKIIDNAHSNFKDNLGEEYDITYEITSKDDMSTKEFDAMVNSLSFGAYNAREIITEATRVEITITAEMEGNELTHVLTLLLTKEDGEWYILNIE